MSIGDLEPWVGDRWEYPRLTTATIRVVGDPPGATIAMIFPEDEIGGVTVQADGNVLSAVNRLDAAGWIVSPMGKESGEVPAFLMAAARERVANLGSDNGKWTTFWMSRRVPYQT
jgi:hypothetical protein